MDGDVISEQGSDADIRSLQVQVALAEFNKLRDEITGRSTTQWTILGLNVTGSATTIGLVIAYKADVRLLLLLPLLTSSLGMLSIDHAYNIARIGSYINEVLKPILRTSSGSTQVMGYEEWVQAYERQTVPRLLLFGIPLVLLYTGVPIGALIETVPTLPFPTDVWPLWVIGLLATVVEIVFWARILVPAFRQAIQRGA